MINSRSRATLMLLCGMCLSALVIGAPDTSWYPVKVISDGHASNYEPLSQVHKAWRICALFPHAMDKYWWGVSWGLSQEAERQHVKLGIYQAGGYAYLSNQKNQFRTCLKKGADAILLASSSVDGMNEEIAESASRGVPVIDLITGVSSDKVAARSVVSYADMSKEAALYLLAQSGNRPITVAWLPGPQDAGWVRDAESGMYRAFRNKPVTVLHGGFAPPELSAQMGLVRAIVKSPAAAPDYFLGNSVAAEAVANFIAYNPKITSKTIAFYATEPVIDLIKQGRVLATVSDSPVLQARIGLDLALRVLEKKAYARRVSPVIDVIDSSTVSSYDYRRIFAPDNLRISLQAMPD